jgi:Tfp pilus assembly protein PilZ
MKSAKNWMVKLYQPEADSVKWRFLFDFLGVESTPLCSEKELVRSLLSDAAGLVIFDSNLLREAFPAIESTCSQWLKRGGGIALTGHTELWSIPTPFLARVTDISERDPFVINSLLQRFVATYSRQHPRLGTRLPGLYTRTTGSCQICEIMNLSPGGAFIRTTESLPAMGEELRVNVPLMGLQKEIEVSCRVVSRLLPNEANNYAQGVGVRFVAEDDSPIYVALNNYVRYVLANDESLDPHDGPFFGARSKKIGHNVKSVPTRTEMARERRLATSF